MALELLRKIGLSAGEIKVYEALLDIGRAPVNRIHEKTGIERRNIYDILNKLIERGLITYVTENKKRFFQLSHPVKIISYIEEKKHELDETKESVEKELPAIMEKFNSAKIEVNAEIYRGYEGVKAVWDDTLNYKETLMIGSGRYIPKNFPTFFAQWNKRRIKLKVKWRNLLRHEMRGELKEPYPYEQMKFLPKEFSTNPMVIFVYGNKVAHNLYLQDSQFSFVINSKEIAENYRHYHNYLWNKVAKW